MTTLFCRLKLYKHPEIDYTPEHPFLNVFDSSNGKIGAKPPKIKHHPKHKKKH